MYQILAKIKQFTAAAKQFTPTVPWPATAREMLQMMPVLCEEVVELQQAAAADDMVKMADALGDIIYVAMWMSVRLGIPIRDVVDEFCDSNLTKLNADGSLSFNEAGKIQKGPNYVPPNIRAILDANVRR